MGGGVKTDKLNNVAEGAGTNNLMSSTAFIDLLSDLFYRGRSVAYGKGEVSMCGHMLQTAELAAEAGAAPPLLVACLLHDVGHLVLITLCTLITNPTPTCKQPPRTFITKKPVLVC